MQKIYRKALRTYVYELHKKFRIRLKDAKELAPEDEGARKGNFCRLGDRPSLHTQFWLPAAALRAEG
jgi:hypothetical protein